MRFVSYRYDGRDHAGLLDDDTVVPLRDITALGLATPTDVLADPALDLAKRVALAEIELRPAVPHPGKIFCVGLNYREHVAETERKRPDYPVLFTKFPSSLIAAGESIQLPPESIEVDYEAELAVVIGRPTRRVRRAAALHHILGYTVANDVTMRDYQYKSHQWLQGKAWDRSTPLGPALITPDEVDPGALAISLRLNGELMQSANTSEMLFDVSTLIATISEFTRLDPGDVILTGTPGGVGYRRDPQVFLRAGDTVEVAIEGLGSLTNGVRRET